MLKIKIDTPEEIRVFEAESLFNEMLPDEIEAAVKFAQAMSRHYQRIANALDDLQYSEKPNVRLALTTHFQAHDALVVDESEGNIIYTIGSLTIIEEGKKL